MIKQIKTLLRFRFALQEIGIDLAINFHSVLRALNLNIFKDSTSMKKEFFITCISTLMLFRILSPP